MVSKSWVRLLPGTASYCLLGCDRTFRGSCARSYEIPVPYEASCKPVEIWKARIVMFIIKSARIPSGLTNSADNSNLARVSLGSWYSMTMSSIGVPTCFVTMNVPDCAMRRIFITNGSPMPIGPTREFPRNSLNLSVTLTSLFGSQPKQPPASLSVPMRRKQRRRATR